MRHKKSRKVKRVVVPVYLSEDMVQQSIICVVIHGLVVLEQWGKVRGEARREKALTGT
jgi:hypothetical protein